MNRRSFLRHSAGTLLAAKTGAAHALPPPASAPAFKTANPRWQASYDKALAVLAANVQVIPRFPHPVLIEGSVYQGIWMECGPNEALVYRKFRPDVARNSHMTFFALQSPEGQLPATNKINEALPENVTGFGAIQMCVPIAATAWELAQATGDDELLRTAYQACSRWDAWLTRYRNTRGTGLIEGFCTYDTGMDNSPRWDGMPNRCPDRDARKVPPVPSLPRLAPDLSATIFGARTALSAMAKALGKTAEADHWADRAETLRHLILTRLYVPEDAAFYDLDAQNHFVKVRCDTLSRICSEHVPDQPLFDTLWTRQIHNPAAFWPAFPLPSVATDDPLFVHPIPRNSWGGASQALTALRATRWFDHYGRAAEFSTMMNLWCEAIQRDMTFRQQIDPRTGAFTLADAPSYSPCALVMVDYTWRLAGIHDAHDTLQWTMRPGHPASDAATFALQTDRGYRAAMHYDARGVDLSLNDKPILRLDGGTARLVTTDTGKPLYLLGVSEKPETVSLQRGGKKQTFSIQPNQRISLEHPARAAITS
jgi:hypothetical protein